MSKWRTLSLIIHGDPGVGKSRLADTSPAPRLIVDAEGGSRFLPSGPKVAWDPQTAAPPGADGSWQTCVTMARDISTVDQAVRWVESGQHGFRSISLDTLTEIQQRCLRAITGMDQPKIQDWGELLRQMVDYVRRLRDCTWDPHNPLEILVVICQTSESGKAGKQGPMVQGQLRGMLPQFPDVVGHMYTQQDAQLQLRRALRVQPLGDIIAKDRTDRLGEVIWDPSMPNMLDAIYGPEVTQ